MASASQYFLTNPGHSISDIESERVNTDRPQYLHDLSTEIQEVHALGRNGQRLFPSLRAFDRPETKRTLTMITAVSERIREMQTWLDAFRGSQDDHAEVPAPPEHNLPIVLRKLGGAEKCARRIHELPPIVRHNVDPLLNSRFIF